MVPAQVAPLTHGSTDFSSWNRFAWPWVWTTRQGPFRRATLARVLLAHGYDDFAHDVGKSLLVEAAIRHETVAGGRAPPVCNFRHINVELQGEMREPMRNLVIEFPVRGLNWRLFFRRGRVEIGFPIGSGYFRHATEQPISRPRADEDRSVLAAHEKRGATAQRLVAPWRLARQVLGVAGRVAATKF